MVLAVVNPVRENREDVVRRGGVGLAEGELGGCRGAGPHRGGRAGAEALDKVVLGEANALVGAHAVVAQMLLAVQAAGADGVAFVARAAPGLALPAVGPPEQQRGAAAASPRRRRAGGGTGRRAAGRGAMLLLLLRLLLARVVMPVVGAAVAAAAASRASGPPVVLLVLGGGGHDDHVEQVAEEEVGGGQRVHARRLRDHHLLVADRAAQLERVPRGWVALRLQALAAEGVQARQDVQAPGRGARGGRRRRTAAAAASPPSGRVGGLRGRRRGGRVGGDGSRRPAHLLAQRADLEIRLGEGSHWEGGEGRGGGGAAAAQRALRPSKAAA